MSMRALARSRHYVVEHEYESAWVAGPDGCRVAIGEFYGDPAVAVIDMAERWCAVAGEGVIVCSLVPGGERVDYFRSAGETVWVTGLRQTGAFSLELRCEDGAVRVVDFGAA